MTTTALDTPPVATPRSARGTAWQRVALSLVFVEALLLYAPVVKWLFGRWTMSIWHNAHGLMIPPVVAYLAWQELKPLRREPAAASAWGFAFLVPALMLHAIDAGMHTELLSAIALVMAMPGLSLLLLGTRRTRAITFPLAFLLFALPIPLGFTEQIHWQLRVLTTAVTSAIVPWLGIPVFVEGTTLHMATGALQVADACSGFSTLYAALAVAFLTAYTAPGTGRKLLVLASAAPLAVASNIVRVTMLVSLVVWKGEAILETWVHPFSGIMTFALALPIIFWLGGDTSRKVAA